MTALDRAKQIIAAATIEHDGTGTSFLSIEELQNKIAAEIAAQSELLDASRDLYGYLMENDVDGLTEYAPEMGRLAAAIAKVQP
jgi:hypothetical protein